MTRVKICGITRPEDAALAVRLGADAIGLVFWPRSPRVIDVDRARAIVRHLAPFVSAVGVFVNQAPEEVHGVAGRVGLGAVQLHGQERVEDYAGLDCRLIKAVPVGAGGGPEEALAVPDGVTVLLDAYDPVRLGGTGTAIDWMVAAQVARARRTILSGGLRPENVGDAITAVRPYGVDVSSGVESAPGVKDAVRMAALFDAVRQVT